MPHCVHKTKIAHKPRVPVKVRPVKNSPSRDLQSSFRLSRLSISAIQPALKVGSANDPLEREAENTAERIVSMPLPEIAPPLADPESGGQGQRGLGTAQRASVDDQPNTDTLEVEPPIPADHQDPDVPNEEDVDTTGLAADDMKEIESGQPEDTAGEPPAEESPPPAADEPAAQPARSGDAAVVGAEGGAAPADVAGRVSQPGSGRPLPASVRTFMEPRFGKDFSDVRIHDAADDRSAALRIGARAFTHRQHIWMGPGESVENRRLMAHELTHVVQQTKRSRAPVIKREVEPTEDPGEPQVRRGYIRNKAEKYARKVPGYRLVSVILGKSPITGNRVERNATNLLGALMAMIPGGGVLFDRLMETRVIQNAFEWVSGRLHSLKITWTRIKGLISDLFDYLPARPSNAIRKAKSLFAPIVRDIITFIKELKDKILEFIIRGALKLAGPLAEKVWGVIKKAGSVISTILKDPLGFAKNLFSAVGKGFSQFGKNIIKHIKKGLLGWLFGAIKGLDIQIPDKLDFKGILSLGLQIVGLTYANFRTKLVERLGANGERKVAYLEKSVEVVKTLVKEGFVGLWQRVLQMIDNFKQTMIGGIQKFVIESLIMGGISWLAGLSNPVGAVVKVVLAIYKIIKTFLERLGQILEVANSIFSSIGAIAAGKIQDAADFIEKTIAATIPVVISFLAALVPITGITSSIRGIIKKLKAPVDKAINKMITFLVKKAKKLFSRIIGKLNKKRQLPSANFKVGKAQHRIYAEKKGKKAIVLLASGAGHPPDTVAAATLAEKKNVKTPEAQQAVQKIGSKVNDADKETNAKEKKVDLTSTNKNQNAPLKALQNEIKEGAREMGEVGKEIDKIPELVENTEGTALLRYSAVRSKIEGKVGPYNELLKELADEPSPNDGVKSGKTYEMDHIPTLDTLQAIQSWLKAADDPDTATEGKSAKLFRSKMGRPPKDEPKAGEKIFGMLQLRSANRSPGNTYPAIGLYAPYHAAKSKDKNVGSQIKQVVDDSAKDTPTKISDLKTLLIGHIDTEISATQGAYASEPITEIKTNVMQGLARLKDKAIFDLQLTAGAKVPSPAAAPSAGSGSREDFTFSDADNEGKHGPHSVVKNKYAKKGFIESDHIVDDAFPVAVKKWTFSKLMGTRDSTLDAANNLKTMEEKTAAKLRRTNLRKRNIFSREMTSYERNTAETVAIFAGVHAAVGPPNVDGLIRKIQKDYNENREDDVVNFVTREGGDPKALQDDVRTAIRGMFLTRFDKHKTIIMSKYAEQKQYVLDINPGKQRAAAGSEMEKIVGRVRESMTVLRGKTEGLFNG